MSLGREIGCELREGHFGCWVEASHREMMAVGPLLGQGSGMGLGEQRFLAIE